VALFFVVNWFNVTVYRELMDPQQPSVTLI